MDSSQTTQFEMGGGMAKIGNHSIVLGASMAGVPYFDGRDLSKLHYSVVGHRVVSTGSAEDFTAYVSTRPFPKTYRRRGFAECFGWSAYVSGSQAQLAPASPRRVGEVPEWTCSGLRETAAAAISMTLVCVGNAAGRSTLRCVDGRET